MLRRKKPGSGSCSVHTVFMISCTHLLAPCWMPSMGAWITRQKTLVAGDIHEPADRRWQVICSATHVQPSPEHKSHEPLRLQDHTSSCESKKHAFASRALWAQTQKTTATPSPETVHQGCSKMYSVMVLGFYNTLLTFFPFLSITCITNEGT